MPSWRLPGALAARLHETARADRWDVPVASFAAVLERSAGRAFPTSPDSRELERHLTSLHLEDLALASRAADLQDKQLGERPRCAECGQLLESQGKQERTVMTHGGKAVRLRRDYARCPACGAGLFPPG